MTGIVKWYNADKAYGFLTDTESRKDYFFHKHDMISPELRSEDKVYFEIGANKKGQCAVQVRRLSEFGC